MTEASHHAQNLLGRVVNVFNKKKGGEMLARTSKEALEKKREALKLTHEKKMDDIHKKHNALPPEFYYGAGPKWASKHWVPSGLVKPMPDSFYVPGLRNEFSRR